MSKLPKSLSKLLSGSLHGLKSARKSLAGTISHPINYVTAQGHKLKRMEEGILKRVMNNMKTKRTHRESKNHLKGGTRRQQRQQRGTRRR